ncbi:hypothetical protein [Nesterenkonia xinjiangensis]|uniref:DUF5129 domain-containing protein n=1 Tax=Nesterenkonia xinjiangensis TaxID=225327 RepID=A0A7Z0GKN5_9MICC|nr:hypothetical protein [Nesterenkonia xinjiangensis]NYJ77745.1 hypothetical protein [Nesterenkonia xinjiangensis]
MTRTTEGPNASAARPHRLGTWLPPALALGLAGSSVGIGAVGYERVTAEPEAEVSFLVEDDLPYGITQETVEAAAEGRVASYEPFTVRVVERELAWDEYMHGEIEDAEMILSVGDDPEDPDLVLADATRVGISGLDSDDRYTVASTVRETFVNNRTIGHGPNAVVGAALTAADMHFDEGGRSPATWVSAAALPLLAGVAIMFLWVRSRGLERQRLRRLSRAKLRLARVVLELDVLELRFETARAALSSAGDAVATDSLAALEADWDRIRQDSLRLARREQELEYAWLGGPAPRESSGEPVDGAPAWSDLEQFEEQTAQLQRRADALAAASELRAGHAGSGSVLDRLALPLLQSVDEVLTQRSRLVGIAGDGTGETLDRLRSARDELLALNQEAATIPARSGGDDGDDGARLVAEHADLLERWEAAERRIVGACTALSGALKTHRREGHPGRKALRRAAEERVRRRVQASSAGATDSLDELRATLGLKHGAAGGPMWSAERVLAAVAHTDLSAGPSTGGISEEGWQAVVATVGVILPVAAGLLTGWAAVERADVNTAFGRSLQGDQPLAALDVVGDPGAVPEFEEPSDLRPSNQDSLTLEYVRESMARTVEFDEDAALLPDHLELHVALLPADDYISYTPRADHDYRIDIDYWDIVDAHARIKEEVGAEDPEVIDPATGEVALGHGILPVWLLDEATFAVGYTMTGEISSGVDSRLGTYSFRATDLLVSGTGDFEITLGDQVANTLQDLGRAMEYNHQESVKVDTTSLFWLVAVAVWTGAQTLLMIGVAVVEAGRRGIGTRRVRRQLAGLRGRLDDLALGLDLSRLDMVAVLGADSATDGRAEQADQRLHEAGLVTAWREVQALERLPRREQRGADWESRVTHVEKLIDTLAARETDVATRAEELLRTQRDG